MVLMRPIYRSFDMPEGRTRRVIRGPAKRFAAIFVALAGGILLALTSSAAYAVNFALNFQPNQAPGWSGLTGVCTFASQVCTANNLGNGDPTPFSETLQNIGGVTYFHVIVGDPASGFASESYTRWGAGPNANSTTNPSDISVGDFSPNAGGMERSVIGNPSTSTTNCTTSPDQCTNGVLNGDVTNPSNTFMDVKSNLGNPLGGQRVSGSGTADPTKTVFRMVMTSAKGDMSMEVVKPFLDKKPKISQTVQDGPMSSSFVADMTAISYSDKNTPAKITNNLVLSTPGLPSGSSANFDMSLSQHPDVTAGRYTFTAGAGWNNPAGWNAANSSFDPGTYNYFDTGGFNPLTFDWTTNFHYNENALSCTRPAAGGRTRNNSMGSSAPGGFALSCPGHP